MSSFQLQPQKSSVKDVSDTQTDQYQVHRGGRVRIRVKQTRGLHRFTKPDPGSELDQVQSLFSLIRSGMVLFYSCRSQVCTSICRIPERIQGDSLSALIRWCVIFIFITGENLVFEADRVLKLNVLLLVSWWSFILLTELLSVWVCSGPTQSGSGLITLRSLSDWISGLYQTRQVIVFNPNSWTGSVWTGFPLCWAKSEVKRRTHFLADDCIPVLNWSGQTLFVWWFSLFLRHSLNWKITDRPLFRILTFICEFSVLIVITLYLPDLHQYNNPLPQHRCTKKIN